MREQTSAFFARLVVMAFNIAVSPCFGFTQDAATILKKMDGVMNREATMECSMEVKDIKNEKETIVKYHFYIKAKENNRKLLIKYTLPLDYSSLEVLMIGKDVWVYDRLVDRIVQIPSNLAFGGTDMAHGDYLRLDISHNYSGKILNETPESWSLRLFALYKSSPYYSIEVEVSKKYYYPVAMRFYASSGKLIKVAEYSEVKLVNGRLKPTAYLFYTPYDSKRKVVMRILNEREEAIPETVFNKWAMRTIVESEF